jgi:hypothetical protein
LKLVLERYAEKYDIEDKTNFYLAKDGVIKSESNNQTLSEIIVKLSEPFSIFSNGGHLGYSTALTDTILKGDHLRIISAKFG